eukprot:4013846-Pleurochrysis_carterae.AAC.1
MPRCCITFRLAVARCAAAVAAETAPTMRRRHFSFGRSDARERWRAHSVGRRLRACSPQTSCHPRRWPCCVSNSSSLPFSLVCFVG